jgi:gluconate 2-dehydrogenase alpha chain
MKTLRSADVVIVGGGWAGLLMAKELGARTGLRIIVLERGKPRKTADYHESMDELDYAIRLRMMQDVSRDTFTFRHSSGERALPLRQHGAVLPGSGTGGAGEHWGGSARRLGPEAFHLRSHLVKRYGAAKLPANSQLQDWGCTYAELEPYYSRAEQLMGVSGQSGLHPFDPPRSGPYPAPPLKSGPFPASFAETARSMGYHPYPAPSAILSQAYKNPDGVFRPACQYCGYCDRFGCMVGAKSQPTSVLMPVIARTKNVTITHDASGLHQTVCRLFSVSCARMTFARIS